MSRFLWISECSPPCPFRSKHCGLPAAVSISNPPNTETCSFSPLALFSPEYQKTCLLTLFRSLLKGYLFLREILPNYLIQNNLVPSHTFSFSLTHPLLTLLLFFDTLFHLLFSLSSSVNWNACDGSDLDCWGYHCISRS